MEIEVNDDNFNQEVIESDSVCVVDFWAEWCGPCMMLAPTLAEIDKEFEGKIKVCKLNVDKNSEISAKYRIMHIPVLLIFKKGELKEQIMGLKTKKEIISRIEPFID